METFEEEVRRRIVENGRNPDLLTSAAELMKASFLSKYSYNFSWLGRPIIQYPQDIVAIQELIWRVKPDLIIETGIAHGGSLILSASIQALLDYCDAVEACELLDPAEPRRKVVGIDIDIRSRNRAAIETHPMSNRIEMIQGSSIAPEIVAQVRHLAKGSSRVLVCLDSKHTHDHVLSELEAYAPLVTPGSYCVVFDTLIEELPNDFFSDRPWGRGDNPMTAALEYLETHPEFVADKEIDHKLMISVARNGYLRRVR